MSNPNGNPGNKGGTGNPGYGKLAFIREQVDKHSKLWWRTWEEMMNDEFEISDNLKELIKELMEKDEYAGKEMIKTLAKRVTDNKKFAMTEFNKLQAKMMPTQMEVKVSKLDDILDACED